MSPPAGLSEAIERVLDKYPKVENVLTHDLEKEVRECLTVVKLDSSPGVPWVTWATTNGKLLEDHEELVVRVTVERLQLLLEADPELLRMLTAEQLVQQGYCDPVRLFVKQEPHTTQKVLEKRFRLICSVSLPDQIIERILARRQNNYEIDHWEEIPSKAGIGFTDDMVRSLWEQVKPLLEVGCLVETDMSGWDWSVQGWELDAEAEMRIRLGADERMARLIRNRFRCLSLSVFCLSNGRMFAQVVPGLMKSGSYCTSSSNSRIRVLAAQLIGADCVAMGDDSLETYVGDDLPERYRALGHRLKQYKRCADGFEFCSQLYQDGTAHPISWPRTFFRLLNQRNTKTEERMALLVQFVQEMRHHPSLRDFTECIVELGWISNEYTDENGRRC